MSGHKIPFNRPCLAGAEMLHIAEAIRLGHSAGDGSFTQRCQALLEKELHVAKALLTTSCTHALEMAALLLDIQPGDEVIAPSFTFVSTLNAFVLRGAKPVFVDIRPDTLNLNEALIERYISGRTRAIVPVHYGGVGCDMGAILEIGTRRAVAVVEDNAHGLFGRYQGRHLGAFGALATLSFHETKNFICGEGGALLINDPSYIKRAEILRQKGTDRSQFLRGEIDKYTWVDIGSSYVLSDILAAFLLAQLESRVEVQAKRRCIWERYYNHLRKWAEDRNVKMPVVPSECEQSYHMFFLVLPSTELRDALIAHLKERNISSVFHYIPLHTSEMGRRFGCRAGDCPVTESVSGRLLRLPFYNDLTEDDQMRVIQAILETAGWRSWRRGAPFTDAVGAGGSGS